MGVLSVFSVAPCSGLYCLAPRGVNAYEDLNRWCPGEPRCALPIKASQAMELPKTLEHCHEAIRALLEENAALRKSGADFGQLAERLSSALAEERGRRAAHKVQKSARTNRKLRWTAAEERAGRWGVGSSAGQTCGPSHVPAGRHVRSAGPAPRPVPFKNFL